MVAIIFAIVVGAPRVGRLGELLVGGARRGEGGKGDGGS